MDDFNAYHILIGVALIGAIFGLFKDIGETIGIAITNRLPDWFFGKKPAPKVDGETGDIISCPNCKLILDWGDQKPMPPTSDKRETET